MEDLFDDSDYNERQMFDAEDLPEILQRPHQPTLEEEDDSEITFVIASLTMS